MYDYVLLLHIFLMISSIFLGYFFIVKYGQNVRSYQFHVLYSFSVLFFTWLLTFVCWFWLMRGHDIFLLIGGSLVTIVTALFCSVVLLASIVVEKNIIVEQNEKKLR